MVHDASAVLRYRSVCQVRRQSGATGGGGSRTRDLLTEQRCQFEANGEDSGPMKVEFVLRMDGDGIGR